MASGPVFPDVSAWFENNCAASLQIVPGAHEFGTLAGLALVRQGDTPVRIPLEDCGEGITQVLPVLVLVALAKHGRLGHDAVIVLEHPDLHLHSNAHYDIIRAIVDATKSVYKPRFLIESHAESVLVATQLHVVSGQLAPQEVCALHVKEARQGNSDVDLVEFDSTGAARGDFAAIDWFERTNARALKLAKDMVGLP
jgi:predicted ATPase